jgi:glycosyltransferase involved in cell wall biosynthesis
MRVCLLTNDYPPITAGMSIYVKGLSEGFLSLGHQCEVLFFPINRTYPATDLNVTILPVKGRWTFSRVLSVKRTLENVKDRLLGADLVVVSSWSPLGLAYKAVLGSKKPTSALVAYGNDVLEPMRSRGHTKRMKGVFEYFNVLAAISRYTASLCNRVTKRDVAVIGGGLNRKFLQNKADAHPNGKDGEFTFLSVGRLTERKGYGLVIESLARIRDLLTNWRYVIIGTGYYENELRALALKHNLAGNIQIMTGVGTEELLEWYRVSDVFVMVSREIPERGEVEGLGLVYMEAGGAFLPVIAGKSGGVVDVVRDGFNGLLVDPLSVEETSQAILKLYRDEHLRKALGANGRLLAESEWTWRKVAERIIAAAR